MLYQEATLLPTWLAESLPSECPYCKEQYHVGYSPNGTRITKHYCPNIECPGTVASKMSFMWTVLGVTGIKFGNSLKVVKQYHIKRHFDSIPHVLKEVPEVSLAVFMRINCINGIDEAWEDACNGKETLEEVLSGSLAQRSMSPEEMLSARDGIQYFKIYVPKKQDYEPIVRMTIMITGHITGIEPRELLIMALNKKYKGLLDLRYSEGKRKTGITALVKERTSNTTGKVNLAKDSGIPIMTPEEFIKFVDVKVREKAGDKYDI